MVAHFAFITLIPAAPGLVIAFMSAPGKFAEIPMMGFGK